MLSLYIFKSNARGMKYGMGTYIRELTESLLEHTSIKISIVNYHDSKVKEFTTKSHNSRLFEISIPSPKVLLKKNNSGEKRYARAVANLLDFSISENKEIVFQMNYVDDLPLIRILKERYSFPIISVVHFSQCQQLFDGNMQKIKGLNIDKPSNNIEFTLACEKEMYVLSDFIISVTRYMKDFLVNEYNIPADRIAIVPNGLKPDKYNIVSNEERINLKKKQGFGADEKIFIFSGRIDKCKGIYSLIDAFIEACRYQDNLRLVIIGQGDIQDCLKKTNSFFGKITYTGFIPYEQVTEFYQIADVGIVPSIYDHCPYTVLEMMAYNIPLILSRINGLNELLNDNQCIFIDPVIKDDGYISFDTKKIAEAILLTVNNKEIVKSMINKYPEIIRARFSSQRVAKDMKKLLENICLPIQTLL